MKPLRVKKFGGAVLSTPEKIKKIALTLQSESRDYQLIVAVSAMGTTTNDLLRLAHAVAAIPNRREMDLLLTVGERISMSLLAIALNDLGCQAVSFTGSQAGIITEDIHGEAQIVELKPARVSEALSAGKIVIIAGYQGVSRSTKDVTTLGRGGTDITAVALAGHFTAERCEILKNVPGIMSADPNIVPPAFPLPYVSYEEFVEMTHWGAKVLNYRAASLALEKKIPLWIGPVGETASHVSCVGTRSMKDDGKYSINIWKEVLWIQSSDSSSKDTTSLNGDKTSGNVALSNIENHLREFEKKNSLSPLHYLHHDQKDGTTRIFLSGANENIIEWKASLAKTGSEFKLVKIVASLTHTGSFLEEGLPLISESSTIHAQVDTKLSRSYFLDNATVPSMALDLHMYLMRKMPKS